MTELERADETARTLIHAYGLLGMVCIFLRPTSDDRMMVMFPPVGPKVIGHYLRAAMDAVNEGESRTLN